MNIIVFGASGGVGKHFTKLALDNGHNVTAFVRSPSKLDLKHERLAIIQGDAFDKEAVKSAIVGKDAVISCLGSTTGMKKSNQLENMTKNIVDEMVANNIQRIIYVASAGIENEIPGVMGKIMIRMLRNVLTDHSNAVNYIKDNNLTYSIVRPMGLNNKVFTGIYKEAMTGVPSTGRTITRANVADFMYKALMNSEYKNTSVGLSD
ncbi:NAD(P)H-binding [Psychrobacillus sp. OK028]|uniref:NAD(P)-dependent oxidoreductase n=1 Tax=Psychrobacillus sp. OK028 TaxID=1884359 RepID=UPI00088B4212|nr:NAD(P)-binding oxidoreductase [Psychrobacillus sp. OK028]SDM85262.1 NAD(P)H-binding [Psychrobacillus sp. OK028]